MGTVEEGLPEERDEEWSVIPPAILTRLREILLAFLAGVPDRQVGAFIEELRGYTEAVRVDPSDMPEAEVMLWWLQGFSLQVAADTWRVYGPAEEGVPPSVDYLRRGLGGVWRLWYPDDPLGDTLDLPTGGRCRVE